MINGWTISDNQRGQFRRISFEQNNGEVIFENQAFIVVPHCPTNPDTLECKIYRKLPAKTNRVHFISADVGNRSRNYNCWTYPANRVPDLDNPSFFNTITLEKVKNIPQHENDLYIIDEGVLRDFIRQFKNINDEDIREMSWDEACSFIYDQIMSGDHLNYDEVARIVSWGTGTRRHLKYRVNKILNQVYLKLIIGLYNELFGLIPIRCVIMVNGFSPIHFYSYKNENIII